MAKQTQKELILTTEQTTNNQLLQIEPLIRIIRGKQVLLDSDLAILYGVETFRLNEQVKRNIKRFPDDFMFRLTIEEWKTMSSQFAITFPKEPVTNCDQFISCQVILDNCRNLRQQVLMFYADFAYYFDWQFIFDLYEIILKYILYPLPKRHKNTYTLLQMCKKKARFGWVCAK